MTKKLTTNGLPSGRRDSQAHVNGRRGLGQRTYRNEIYARLGVCPHVLEIDSTCALERNPARVSRADLDRFTNIFNAHMVEKNRLGTVLQCLLQLFEGTDFDFDRLPSATVVDHTLERRDRASRQHNVIVLDQYTIRKIQAMILTPAAAHGIFVNHAQPWRRFAGIENMHTRAHDGIDELASDRRDTAHPLQEIKDHPLTGQNHPRVMLDDCNRLARVYRDAIKNRRMARDLIMRSYGAIERGVDVENSGNASEAGENALLFGDDGCRGALVGIYAGVTGRVARRAIFVQRILENCRDAS